MSCTEMTCYHVDLHHAGKCRTTPFPQHDYINLEHSGKWFVADARWDEKAEQWYYCVHAGTTSANRLAASLDWEASDRYYIDRSDQTLFVFEAKNRTQCVEWLTKHGYLTNHYGYRPFDKDQKMNVRERKIAQAQRTIERAERMLDRLASIPEEPKFKGDKPLIVYFQKRFSAGGQIYDYAAIKANGLWYTTGPRSPKGYSWDDLMDWILDDGGAGDVVIYRAKRFDALI